MHDCSPPCSPYITYGTYDRVWKGIFRIWDLTKIRCGIRENEKYLDGIRDFPAPREPGSAKIWMQDAGFFCLFVGNVGNRHDPNKRFSKESRVVSDFSCLDMA